jgi:hypothetical protein
VRAAYSLSASARTHSACSRPPLVDSFDHPAKLLGLGFGDCRQRSAGFQGLPKLFASIIRPVLVHA